MRRVVVVAAILSVIAGLLATATGPAAGAPRRLNKRNADIVAPVSGSVVFGDIAEQTAITECPQAGLNPADQENPLDQRVIDQVEQLSDVGDDIRVNTDYSCFPQNETSIAFNPTNLRNLSGTQNDYRTRSRQGFNSTTDRGASWYSAELPPPSKFDAEILDASGDPVSVFDREGIAYSSSINFNRTDDTNGIMVQRSTNGGFTWTRPCIPNPNPETGDPDDNAFCNDSSTGGGGGIADPRQPGDGVVTFQEDDDDVLNDSVVFDDKEWLAAGPRPSGVAPQCFTPVERDPTACDPDAVGVDRLYVTWTRFATEPGALFGFTAIIHLSYSDDQGRSWSPAEAVSGSAPFCFGTFPPEGTTCDLNQFSVPTVHPTTGVLGIAFENFNTFGENQYLFIRSGDGGATFEGPFHVSRVFDINYPLSVIDRPDCGARGQPVVEVLTNTCFRVNAGGNVVVDKRGGAFADDYYLIMSDNRNGTIQSSNTDVFFFKSTNGGETWIGPTRVNNDPSDPPEDRNCGVVGEPPAPCPTDVHTGNDQWFPWMDIRSNGVIAAGFHDRRLDTASPAGVGEWPTSKSRVGNYLAWFFGAGCKVTTTATVNEGDAIPAAARQCLAPEAAAIPQPTAPPEVVEGPVPGAGPAFLGPFRNSVISDVPSNMDYSFRGGVFMGDYNAVAFPNVPPGGGGRRGREAVAFWTDARNGRGSGGPDTLQPGRNPQCEQSDVFIDFFNPRSRKGPGQAAQNQELFWVTPCPTAG